MISLPRQARAVLFSVFAAACSQTPLPPGLSGPSAPLCTFPRACYLKDCKTCDKGIASCRVWPGINLSTADLGMIGPRPQQTDPGVICLTDMDDVQCLIADEVCAPQGSLCYGTCVRKGQTCPAPMDAGMSSSDGGLPDLGGTVPTRCLYADDVCCGQQVGAPPDGGPAPDAGRNDAALPSDMAAPRG